MWGLSHSSLFHKRLSHSGLSYKWLSNRRSSIRKRSRAEGSVCKYPATAISVEDANGRELRRKQGQDRHVTVCDKADSSMSLFDSCLLGAGSIYVLFPDPA